MKLSLFTASSCCFVLSYASYEANAFSFGITTSSSRRIGIAISSSLTAKVTDNNNAEEVAPDDYDLLPPEDEENNAKVNDDEEVRAIEATELKRKLYQLAASYDRGFGATPKARSEASDIIEQLADINPTKINAANGIDGETLLGEDDNVPLKGIWRMVWTSAFDVVSLGASPFAGKPCAVLQMNISIIICPRTKNETNNNSAFAFFPIHTHYSTQCNISRYT